jgi:hypothetical protein
LIILEVGGESLDRGRSRVLPLPSVEDNLSECIKYGTLR